MNDEASRRHSVESPRAQRAPDAPAPIARTTREEATVSNGNHTTDCSAFRVRCPHCRNTVASTGDASLGEIDCGVCGGRFSLVQNDETLSYSIGPGQVVGNFELIEAVGRGQYGTVWKARDRELDRLVALKLPRKSQLDPEEAERVLREARAAAQTRHPNIIRVHEVGREEDRLYIVTDFIDGASLADILSARRPSSNESARLLLKTTEALHAAHEAGVVHRDVKPGNIMVDGNGAPYVTDFGLARRELGEVTVTIDGQLLGTPAYMSPEQARGEGHRADRRSDIFSLGVILYELLTGEKPFRGTAQAVRLQILRDDPVPVRKLNALVPRDLETICAKCLEKDPNKRYQTAGELAHDLRRFLDGRPIEARPVGTLGRIWRWYARHPEAATYTAGGAAVFMASVMLCWGFLGLITLPLFGFPSEALVTVLLETVALVLFFDLPLLWAGIQTLNQRLRGIVIGLALSITGLALSILGLAVPDIYDPEIFGSLVARMPFFHFLIVLFSMSALLHAVALYGYQHRVVASETGFSTGGLGSQ